MHCIAISALSRSADCHIPTKGAPVLRKTGIAIAVVASAAALTSALPAQAAKPVSDRDIRTGPALGIVHARGAQHNAKPTSSVNMLFHNGSILASSETHAIFWGKSWGTNPGDKISGMDSWYDGFGGSNYAKTTTEYTGNNGQVGTDSKYTGHDIDTSQAPSGAPSTDTILSEVAKVIGANAKPNGYYPVYVDQRRGNAGYCAWHSYGAVGSVPVQFAFFFKLDGDAGCDPVDTSGLHSQGLAAIANVSGHELAETMTDPRNGGWYDRQGAENGDKCAWTFGAPLVTFSNGSQWKIQGEWSNAAFSANNGYPNNSGQRGCLSGL